MRMRVRLQLRLSEPANLSVFVYMKRVQAARDRLRRAEDQLKNAQT